MIEGILSALSTLVQPEALFLLVLGTVIGFIFGVLPGLGGSAALALALPLIFGMNPSVAMYFLAGILGSNPCGGSITAILLNTPGSAVNAATCLDGYPMAKKGEAGRAISLAAWASGLGALFGVVVLIVLIPVVRAVIMNLSPVEFFMLCLLGISIVPLSVRGNMVKGFASVCIGILLSFIGFNLMTGTIRFNFHTDFFWDGIPIVPFFIGLFGIGEMLNLARAPQSAISLEKISGRVSAFVGLKGIMENKICFLRSSVIGTIVGIIPGIGGSVSNWVSYVFAHQFSRSPEKFGTGAPEGVIASESANNAKDGGALVPTLAFGIPGSVETAVILGGFVLVGIAPGPSILIKHQDVVWSIIFGLVLSNVLASFFALFMANTFARITRISNTYIIPIVVILCFLGSFAVREKIWDVACAVFFGFIGLGMRKAGFPIVPMIMGFILGKLLELYFLQSLMISDGSLTIFLTRPISLLLFISTLAIVMLPLFRKSRQRKPVG